MLQTIGEWYKLIDLDVKDEMLDKRKAAATALVDDWAKLTTDAALEVASLAVDFFSSDRKLQTGARDQVLNAIRTSQPSFDVNSATVEADLRACCAVALNELFARHLERRVVPRSSLAAASCIISALRWRSTKLGIHATACMSSLLMNAEDIVDVTDERRRLRKEVPTVKYQRAFAEDSATLVSAGEAIDQIYSEMLKDREEIQALWWVFGGFSHLTKKSFKSLDVGTAAVIAGCELAQIIKAPATHALTALSARAVRAAIDSENELLLKEILSVVHIDTWKLLTLSARCEALVRRHWSIFPISYLGLRLLDGSGTIEDNLKIIPDWGSMDAISPESVAMQMFAERVLISQIESK